MESVEDCAPAAACGRCWVAASIATCIKGAAVAVTVSNPGPGIDSACLPRLFDRFYRADPARSDSASSAGLGLAIVQTIMALHGGQAEVESALNGLTTFRLVFQQ